MSTDNQEQTAKPMLHLVCGKICSGKSTLVNQLAQGSKSILLSEDAWLTALYPGEIKDLRDYVRYSGRLKTALGGHIQALLVTGNTVVLDFPANTVEGRLWLKTLFETAGVAHELHFLDVPDDICKARLQARNATGEHPFKTTDAEYDLISSYFVPPAAAEGFNIIRHKS
ncbi:ATP-binding protein [Sneathiella marina]|uniref:ATP-binding protein n=1 Tax=Sneathiella marina TaxID=2950108 RepID=A0ABY4W7Q6_9PROT|nr:ATP-binding protein [Sneathiella marina]USG63208.1 ATP-binding protein [Sneathiella marina]